MTLHRTAHEPSSRYDVHAYVRTPRAVHRPSQDIELSRVVSAFGELVIERSSPQLSWSVGLCRLVKASPE